MKTSSPVDRSQEWMSLKEGTEMKSILASIAIILTFYAAPAVSAEFPKTGEAEYVAYCVAHPDGTSSGCARSLCA